MAPLDERWCMRCMAAIQLDIVLLPALGARGVFLMADVLNDALHATGIICCNDSEPSEMLFLPEAAGWRTSFLMHCCGLHLILARIEESFNGQQVHLG